MSGGIEIYNPSVFEEQRKPRVNPEKNPRIQDFAILLLSCHWHKSFQYVTSIFVTITSFPHSENKGTIRNLYFKAAVVFSTVISYVFLCQRLTLVPVMKLRLASILRRG